jgi:pyruvate carboxylase
MKMETVVSSPVAGKVERVVVAEGDTIAAGDLLCQVDTTA